MAKERIQKLPPKTLPTLDVQLNNEQERTTNIIKKSSIVYIDGKAGSGKTLTALVAALNALHGNEINTIFITRPYVTADESMGFLPGDLKQKMDPYLIPIYDNLIKIFPRKEGKTGRLIIDKYMENGELEIAPLGFMRGRTFVNSFLILDEAQNITESQLKMAMTRLGKGSKMIICGDIDQCDLHQHRNSGLVMLEKIIQRGNIEFLEKVSLKNNHRDPIVQQLLEEFEKI